MHRFVKIDLNRRPCFGSRVVISVELCPGSLCEEYDEYLNLPISRSRSCVQIFACYFLHPDLADRPARCATEPSSFGHVASECSLFGLFRHDIVRIWV